MQLRLAKKESKYPEFDAYAFELTQAIPPVVLHGPNSQCARPLESISVGELIQIMVDYEALPAKKVELSAWGRPKISGYGKYRWDATPKTNDADNSWLLSIGVHVTGIEDGWVNGWIEWRTRAIDHEYVYGRRVQFQQYKVEHSEADMSKGIYNEKHCTPQELVETLNVSVDNTIRWFSKEPGVNCDRPRRPGAHPQ